MKHIALVLALAFLAACSDSTAPTSIVGTWNLSTVDGQAIPFTLLAPTATSCGETVRSGQFDLKADSTYTGVESYGTLTNGTLGCSASYIEGGTYTIDGGIVVLINLAGEQNGVVLAHDLTIGRGALTRFSGTHLFVYTR